jgi:Tfp pilus assembly protein PilO
MAITVAHRWYAGAAAASVGILAAGYFLLVSPQQSSAADTTAQAGTVEQSNVAAQHQIDVLKAQYKDLPTLQGQVAAIRTRIPQSPQEPTLLRTLAALAKSSGVTLVSIGAQNPAPVAAAAPAGTKTTSTATLSAIPLTIEINGTFANTRLFLTGIESMRRSMLVTSIDVSRLEGDTSGTTAAARVGGVRTVLNAKIFMSSAAATPTVGATATTSATTTATQPS